MKFFVKNYLRDLALNAKHWPMSKSKFLHPLNLWLRRVQMTNVELAELVGVHPVTISKWRCGLARPGFDSAMRLDEVSNGSVPLDSWISKNGK